MNKSNEKVTQGQDTEKQVEGDDNAQETPQTAATASEILDLLGGKSDTDSDTWKSQVGGIFSVDGQKAKYLWYDHGTDRHMFALQTGGKYKPNREPIGLSYEDMAKKHVVRVVGDLKHIPEEEENQEE